MYEFDIENIEEKNRILKQRLEQLERKRKNIQNKFKFKIPTYVLDEIIESNDRILKDNLNAIINLATVNDRISLEEAETLKKYYVFNNSCNIN